MREDIRRKVRFGITAILFVFMSTLVFGEGTKEIMPTAADIYYLEINRSGGQNTPFAAYTPNTITYQPGTSSVDYRLNVKVCNVNEKVRFGFASNSSKTYVQVKRSSDNAIVFGPMLIPGAAGSRGYINSYSEAVAGPGTVIGSTGYLDTGFVATAAIGGAQDYYFEFNQGSGTANTTYQNNDFTIRYFDITVVGTAGTVVPGRLWSKAWQFVDGGSAFNGNFYVYSDDQIVTKLNSNGMAPQAFAISCNATGVSNTGNPTVDQKSIAGPSTYPQYKLFLNNPDSLCYPTGTYGHIVGGISISGCGTNRCININVDKPGNILITLDLNNNGKYDPGTSDRQITYTVKTSGLNCIPWDGLDGLGNNIPTGTVFNVQVDFRNGITHLPLYDCEDNQKGFIVNLIRPLGASPRLFWDDSNVIPAQYGSGTALDGITNLGGCTNATGCHQWKSRGSNTCPPCSETLNTWWYANIDSRTVSYTNTNVFADADSTTVGTGYASNSFSNCNNGTAIQLKGKVSGSGSPAPTGIWTAPAGDGVFTPNATTLAGTYTPGPNDLTAGSVKLILTTVGGICPSISDSMVITLVKPPVVFAGVAKSACKTNSTVSLSDATQNAYTNSVVWSGGSGTYTANKTTLNITYKPTNTEMTNGSVTLTLTGKGNAPCPNSVSTVTISYYPAPTASAGSAKTVCSNIASALTGTVSAGATPAWTSSSGCSSCFGNPGAASTTYTPSATDIANGTVKLTLTASVSGCTDVTSSVTWTITPAPVPYAGPDQSICKNNTTATLAGTLTNGTGATATWSSSSGCGTPACFTSSLTTLANSYKASATDLTNNTVTLTLTATKVGCANATSSMVITYTAIPTIDVGPASMTFCIDNPHVPLTATFTGPAGVGVQWSGGIGSYNPNSTSPSITYNVSPTEILFGGAGIYATTTNVGNCKPVKDSIFLTPVTLPTVNAGVDKSVCRNNPTVSVTGTVTGSTSGTPSWTSVTSGSAGFSSPNSLTTNYTLNATDLANGGATLILSASPIDPSCAPKRDTMLVSITAAPTVSAGANQTGVCYNPGQVSLNGFSSTGSGTWSGGAGTFSPSATTANATYNSTAGERGGTVTLTYTSAGNVNCNAVAASMTVTFAPQITVNANTGAPITICANNATATLSGSSSTGSGQWSGGAGTYNPNNTTLNATYTPTATEISNGSVTLTLTATSTGGCTAPTSNVTITINAAPTIPINGGAATANICADNPNVNLSVTLPGGGVGVVWTGGAGTYTPNNTSSSISYKATNGEISTGSVILTATTTNPGLCKPVSSQINVVIAPAPTINAGSDQVLCGSTTSANLNGTVTGATGGTWTTNGSGTFANPNALITTYTPSAADKSLGIITLTLTSTGMGSCNAVSDQMTISFTVVPTVDAGPDIIVCSNTLPAQLNGSGSPGVWSGGAGTYSPNASTGNATYTPTATEISNGSVTLTLTTNPSGACPQKTDQVLITIKPSPIANAGSDMTVCGNQGVINISGSVNAFATGGFWTTTGSGTIGNPSALNTTYTPSAADKSLGTVTLTLTTTGNNGCNPHSDNMIITISPSVSVNAGPDQTLCQDGANIALSGTVAGATGGTWSIVTGAGSINNPTSVAGATYTPNAADLSITLRLTTTGNPTGCAAMTDDITIMLTPKPVITIGGNQTVCGDVASVSLTGSVVGATGLVWTTTGAGTFNPSNTVGNTSYIPAANETGTFTFTLTSTGNGVCSGVYSKNMTVTITPKPTINAGLDKSVCKNNPAVTVTATVTVATGGIWTTLGDGTFSGVSGNGLTATYNPGPNDLSNGSVNLRVTSSGNGTCNPVNDIMVVTITPPPTVNAGLDRTVCANNGNVSLVGNVTIATGGTWTTLGSGSFSGVSANGLNATYTPGNPDTTAHTVKLVLTSTGNGTCNAVKDTMIITITPAPLVNAGPDQVICADSFFVKLNARFRNATAGKWTTTGTGSFFNSNSTYDTATYVPSPADRAAGSVKLTWSTTVQGSCNPVSDDLLITITTAPTAAVGSDQKICSDGGVINISGSTNAIPSGVKWTTSGSGTFGSNTSKNTTYNASAVDRAAGTVVLTMTTTGNGTCKPASDQMILNITPKSTVSTGLPLTVCNDIYNTGIQLNPTVTHDSSVTWTSPSGGAFGPNENTKAAIYYPSIADTTSKTVTLTLTATGFSPCTPSSANLTINFTPIPLVNAGADIEVCNGSTGNLNGQVRNATGGTWSTTGSGTFAPDQHTLNAKYIPSPLDTTSGSVTLTLTSTGMGTCAPVSDQMKITFRKRPTINAGVDDTTCADASSYALNATMTNATGAVWSSSSGGGFFPATGLSTAYFLTPQDSTNGTVVLTVTTTGTGTCAPASDNLILTISPVPSADAGPPSLSVCKNDPSVSLNGSVVNATGGYWSTTGDGSFNDPNILNTVYSFGGNDIATGTVKMIFISQGNGGCNYYSDTMRINLTPATNVDAGPDRTICRTDFPITLQGSGASGVWSYGTPAQYGNINSLTSTYMPTAGESAGGTLKLKLTPTGSCAGNADSVVFTFINGPSVHINPLLTICTNVNTVTLSGTSTPVNGGNWTSTGGTAGFASTTNINTTYTLSSTDKTAGQVKFTYTIPSNGICNLVRDSATIRINPTPVVNAGPDQSLCANALSTVTMNGSYTVASGIQWTTVNGTGSISNSTVTNAQYNPMAGDIPLTPIKMVISTTGASFCSVQTDTMLINITPAPTAVIGSDTTMCADKTAQLTAVTTVASGGIWSTTGTGTFSPNNSAKTVVYTPSKADTSSASHSVTISYLTTGNGICAAVNASKIIHMTVKPIVMAGIDDTICSGQDSVALFASNFVNAPGILWTSTGTGTFSPSNTNISAYYIPSVDDKANGGAIIQLTSTGVAECDPVTDYKTLMIIPSPVASVNAGFDQIICRDESYAQMAGFILIATGAKWDCQGSPCSGSFYPNDQDLNARYIPSATDTAAGSVILRLTTTTGNGICAPVWDEMKLTIIDIPRVNAGNPQTVCADTAGIQLGGTINHATLIPPGYSWVSSGNGYFAPNAFVANPVYVPDATDKVNGQVSFTLTSTNNGTCHPYSASVLTTILPQPTISAGLDKATCANVSNITIAGTMTHATTATWSSTGSGSIAYNGANGLNITYTPSAIDDTAGTVTLTIRTASGLGSCKSVSDQMVLTIGPAPIVNAGVDHTICADNGNVAISGTVSAAATGGLWTTLGSGNFASNTSLNTTYKPSNADTTSHSVKLVLTSTGNGLCLPVQDTIQLAIVPKPVVVAGNTHICEVVNGAALNGIVNNAGGGIWTTSGSGTFAVNAATLNATYYPSAADASAGSVVLTLSSTSNGTCNAVSSTTNLAITRIPLANAGPDQFICQNTSTTVNAIMDPLATTYNWSTFTGTIVGNTTAYSFVADKDTAFILTVYDYKGCASIKDTVNVRTFQMPTLSLNGTSCFSDNNDITSTPTPGLPAVPGIYQWYNPGIMTGQNADELHPNVKGSYYLTFSYGGCSAISDTFTVNPSPTVAGIDKTNCANHVTTLATSSVTGGTTFQYIWSSDPSIVGANSDSSQIMVNTSLTFDTIPYRVTVRNNFGCSTNDSIYLVSVASPLITLQNDTLCQNQTTTLVADASNYGVGSIPPIESYFPTYTWTRDGVNLNNNSKTQLVTVPGQYIVQITIGDCIDNKDTSNVLYNKFAIFDLPDKTRFCKETDSVATLNATAQAQAGYTLSYFWSPTNDTTAVIKADEEGYYKVTVSSHIGNSSCPVSDSIFVRNVCAPRVFVPNVFTPDGTTNKNFKVFGSHYTNFKITIFSRWGEVIFSSEDLDFMNNVGWDGTYKGRAMPMGVYTYIIYYDGEDADYTGPYRKDGDILIMR